MLSSSSWKAAFAHKIPSHIFFNVFNWIPHHTPLPMILHRKSTAEPQIVEVLQTYDNAYMHNIFPYE